MKKTITIIALCFSLAAGAQDAQTARMRTTLSFSGGLQFFKLNSLEEINENALQYNMPFVGYYETEKFSPTVLYTAKASFPVFKSHLWMFEISGNYGKNRIEGQGFSSDVNNNNVKSTSSIDYEIISVGYGIKTNISLGRYGIIQPTIGFHLIEDTYYINSVKKSWNRNTGETRGEIKTNENHWGSSNLFTRTGILMLFDNPKIGLDYQLPISRRFNFLFSYSYWRANAFINDAYGISKRLLINYNGAEYYHYRKGKDDLYSMNLSLGLSVQLRK